MDIDRQDALVRQATTVDGSTFDALAVPAVRNAILDDITDSRRVPKTMLALAVAAVTTTVVLVVWPSAPVPVTPPAATATVVTGPTGAVIGELADCAGEEPESELRKREFAFDGTITTVGELGQGTIPVTFQVGHWFTGGSDPTTMVRMFLPAEAFGGPYRAGMRLLVAGDQATARPCGLTRWYSPGDAATWARVFG